ncbi:MAG: HAMP domain-containing protein, partial [Bdellovibrionales bacterium]|nr:HAMP domain-containing protein [Bdellovibrionales bacterium]
MNTKSKPQKSLRTILILWFLFFSLVPLGFITGFSIVKYEEAIDKELSKRLKGNFETVENIVKEFAGALTSSTKKQAENNTLAYYVNNNQKSQVVAIVTSWLVSEPAAHHISIFSREGRMMASLIKDATGNVQTIDLGSNDFFLRDAPLEELKKSDLYRDIEIKTKKDLKLIVVTKIRNNSGRVVGYIEKITELDKAFLESLKKRMTVELAFYLKKPTTKEVKEEDSEPLIVTSNDDLDLYKPEYFLLAKEDSSKEFFELNIGETPYGFITNSFKWGENELFVAIGTSKKDVKSALKEVNYAFYLVVGGIIIFLIILSIVISMILLRPVSELVEAFRKVNPGDVIPEVKDLPENELGVLAQNFNNLSKRVNKTQEDLKNKIKELEQANQEIRETQAKLIHSGKMASLGQLVAGVAHELNNPIGFIYSNMGHLRDYSKSLMKIVETAEKNPKNLSKIKEEEEFEYIVKDMPKLIQSCEEGAKRTRDIVLGLRNFSRLEEAKLKKVNIEQSLNDTLNLLSGELKNRIRVEKDYAGIPEVNCYPSQLNQVFMNILSNAAQAIEENGTIRLGTREVEDGKIEISIKDSGKGMSQETIEKVFDPFFTTKTLGKGTGLGMSISYGIIQKHGGDIQVQSEIGKGTTFTLILPIDGPPA